MLFRNAFGLRSRWASAGAIAALLIGAGGVLTSSADAPVSSSALVPITPCRLLDTRPAPDNVGTRVGALGANETMVAAVRGTNGNCTIPTTATAVSLTVTTVAPTSQSFLTVFPSDAATRPLSSNANWVAGQAPTASAVTALLSADGSLSFYNLSGTVHLVVDIVGYYVPSTSGPAGPVGPAGPAGAQGTPGLQGAPAPRAARELIVSSSGGDYTSLPTALEAIGTTLPAATASTPYVIHLGPGIYDVTAKGGVVMKDHVDIEGAGRGVTTITCNCPNTGTVRTPTSTAVTVEMRHLSIVNTNSGVSQGAWIVGPSTATRFTLRDADVTATGAGALAVGSGYVAVVLDDVALVGDDYGFWTYLGSYDLFRVTADGHYGAYVAYTAGTIRDSALRSTNNLYGLYHQSSSSVMTDTAVLGPISSSGGTLQCSNVWDAGTLAPRTC